MHISAAIVTDDKLVCGSQFGSSTSQTNDRPYAALVWEFPTHFTAGAQEEDRKTRDPLCFDAVSRPALIITD